jgi:hypothetical protein
VLASTQVPQVLLRRDVPGVQCPDDLLLVREVVIQVARAQARRGAGQPGQRLAVADLVMDNSSILADLDRRIAAVRADLTRRVAVLPDGFLRSVTK